MVSFFVQEIQNIEDVREKEESLNKTNLGAIQGAKHDSNYAVIDKAMKMIEDITREVEEGQIYTAKVVKVEPFGCFVEVWPGCEGLVHISKLSKERVDKVEDIVKVGDEIVVKAIGTDNKGRLNFSRKDAM